MMLRLRHAAAISIEATAAVTATPLSFSMLLADFLFSPLISLSLLPPALMISPFDTLPPPYADLRLGYSSLSLRHHSQTYGCFH